MFADGLLDSDTGTFNPLDYRRRTMIIRSLNVTNFRGLQTISLSNANKINVIVGPNVIGKSTILKSIRLAKVILAPKSDLDTQQTLTSLGVLSQFNQVIGSSGFFLANEGACKVLVQITLMFDNDDIVLFKNNMIQLSMLILRSQANSQGTDGGSLIFTQFLSTQQGRDALASARITAINRINRLTDQDILEFCLTIDVGAKQMFGTDLITQSAITIIDGQLPAHMTYFSLFPADRTLPQGVAHPIRLGRRSATTPFSPPKSSLEI